MSESKNKVPRALATAGQPRRKVRTVITRTRVTAAMVGVLVTLVGAGVWWSLTSDGLARGMEKAKWDMIARTAQLGFRVEDILVVGRVETPREELLKAVRLSRGAPILEFDIEAARQRVEALPWIRSARVERMLPDTILLNVEERHPLALWQHQGQFALIDHEGLDFSGFKKMVILQLRLTRASDEQIREWFEVCDRNGNGRVEADEFFRFSLKCAHQTARSDEERGKGVGQCVSWSRSLDT